MLERLIVCCGVYLSATQWRAACNNQSETSIADACTAVCKRPPLTLYQPVAKVISAFPQAIFSGLIQVDRMIKIVIIWPSASRQAHMRVSHS